MKVRSIIAISIAASAALVVGAQNWSSSITTPPMHMSARADADMVNNILSNWMNEPRMTAQKVIDKYGKPNEASDTHLTWWHNGPWKFTKIENVAIPHNFPAPHHDMLQQGINWRIPPRMYDMLGQYDGSVIVDRTRGEVSARCDREEANFLALNLAHDIVAGKRNVAGARNFYAATIKQLKANRLDAAHRPYVKGFLFNPSRQDRPDSDMPPMGR